MRKAAQSLENWVSLPQRSRDLRTRLPAAVVAHPVRDPWCVRKLEIFRTSHSSIRFATRSWTSSKSPTSIGRPIRARSGSTWQWIPAMWSRNFAAAGSTSWLVTIATRHPPCQRFRRKRPESWPQLGLKIVAVWEQNSPDPENLSYSSGYSEAFSAYEQAKAIGQPAGSAIYFAIDFNAHELEPAKEYFRGRAVPACSPPRWKTPGSSQSASRRGSAAIPGIPVCRALTNRLRRGDLARWRCCRLPDGRRPPPEARAAFAAAAARLATAGIALADRHADPVIEEVEGAIADLAQLTRTINAWEAHTGCYVKCSAIGLLKREGYRTQSRNFIPKIVSQAAVALGKVVSRLVNRFDLPREAVAEQPLRVIRAGARLDMQ